MTHKNIQCECGVCCDSLEIWEDHSKATNHIHWQEKTVLQLTNDAMKAVKGLETFNRYLTDGGKC